MRGSSPIGANFKEDSFRLARHPGLITKVTKMGRIHGTPSMQPLASE
jgi:hypothetical protein